MPFDRARADEELRADLRVRQAVAGEPGDLSFLCGRGRSRVSTFRLCTVAPVASSSRRVRSAKLFMPIALNISYATFNSVRASTRRFVRRSHSP
mgnify:CR=1 FL=1